METYTIKLSPEDAKRLAEHLEKPGKPNAELKKIMREKPVWCDDDVKIDQYVKGGGGGRGGACYADGTPYVQPTRRWWQFWA